MTGVDLSEECISEAIDAGRRNGVPIDLLSLDMSNLPFEEEFDGAFCFGNSFGYTNYDDTTRFLDAVQRSLRPGAKFTMETGIVAESLLPSLLVRHWHRAGDVIALSENLYDPAESLVTTEYTFLQKGEVETNTATYSIYTVAELKRILARNGLIVQNLYATTSREPYFLGSPRLLITAQKR
jgi:ubiquinone/menaquinone biosynthesis C-methylase UbiE